ncbi:hypothetical protein NC653_010992, partial [Populus alba x Populus x berolinensis]
LSNTTLKDTTKGSLLDYLDVPRIKIEHFCNGFLLCSSAYLLKPMEQIKNKSGARGVPMPPANLVDYCSYVINDDDNLEMPQDTDSVIWGVSWPFEHGRCR